MRRIVAIGTAEKSWELRDNLSAYLAAFAYPWLTQSGLAEQPAERIGRTQDQRQGLKDALAEALRYLVTRLYAKPSDRQLTLHPNRFERIEVDGQPYLVNYRTSEPGWLMFALFTYAKSVSQDQDVVITLAPLLNAQ
jgi:hypothetical protein